MITGEADLKKLPRSGLRQIAEGRRFFVGNSGLGKRFCDPPHAYGNSLGPDTIKSYENINLGWVRPEWDEVRWG